MDRTRAEVTEHRRKFDPMMTQVKRWGWIIGIIFTGGIIWGSIKYEMDDHERRLNKIESFIQDIPEMKADIKTLSRDHWHDKNTDN